MDKPACPRCKGTESKVQKTDGRHRRRICLTTGCGKVFQTLEHVVVRKTVVHYELFRSL